MTDDIETSNDKWMMDVMLMDDGCNVNQIRIEYYFIQVIIQYSHVDFH